MRFKSADILTKGEFSKANGLVSLAGSSRYLFSPIIAGLLLSISSINTILIIDILTFFITIISTLCHLGRIYAMLLLVSKFFNLRITELFPIITIMKMLQTIMQNTPTVKPLKSLVMLLKVLPE